MLVHILLLTAARPMTVADAPPQPLQVEIVNIAPGPEVSRITTATPADFQTPASHLPARAAVQPAERPHHNTAAEPVAGPDLRLVPDQYYTSRELDVRAEPLNDISLVYPQLAYQKRMRGMVVLRMLINERGGIDDVAVLESEPYGIFEEAAAGAARAMRFSPAIRNGRPVKSQKTVEVPFDPYESIRIP